MVEWEEEGSKLTLTFFLSIFLPGLLLSTALPLLGVRRPPPSPPPPPAVPPPVAVAVEVVVVVTVAVAVAVGSTDFSVLLSKLENETLFNIVPFLLFLFVIPVFF